MHKRGFTFAVLLTTLTLVGSGCVPEPLQTQTPEEAALSLSFSLNDHLTVKPTVLGVSGDVVDWFGGDALAYDVTMTEWNPGVSAGITWSVEEQVETAQSMAARAEYENEYGVVAIGQEVPDPPEPEYESIIQTGSVRTDQLSTGETMLLPSMWQEGNQGSVEESLIWLSTQQYQELVNTRSTNISLGLFDQSLASIEQTGQEVVGVVSDITKFLQPLEDLGLFELDLDVPEVQEQDDGGDITQVQADGDWDTYTVKIDGVRTQVRAIRASNAFATYKVLANPDNPLVLEVQFTPLAQGSLDLGSLRLSESFGGYEITQIKKTSE